MTSNMEEDYCMRCGSKRVSTPGFTNKICPANCDSPYMLHNRIKDKPDDL